MLTIRKINDRNKSAKCNYSYLVYKHNSDIMDCDYLGEKLSRSRNIVPDEWDNKEIKWNVSDYPALKIMRLRSECFERIAMILAAEASNATYRMQPVIEVKFYLIDKEGNKIEKHPIL